MTMRFYARLYIDTELKLKWQKGHINAKSSYETGICDFFPNKSQMQQRR